MTNGSQTNGSQYDVFLSYNSLDNAHVERIGKGLKQRRCSSFLDRWYLKPGHDWIVALEQALNDSRAVAIFISPHGMGRWQQRERTYALNRQTKQTQDQSFPVIPILLPGCQPPLGFLEENMWIDLRDRPVNDADLDRLAAAIQGEPVRLDGQQQPRLLIEPYRGLLPFREEDADFFFGRKTYCQQLVDLVHQRSLVAVVGASGSGKSSLVSAGLVPELRRQPGSPVWDIIRMVPDTDPLYRLAEVLIPLSDPELLERSGSEFETKLRATAGDLEQEHPQLPLSGLVAAALRKQPGTERLLLFVDQWEELYTSCKQSRRRERFVQELLDATADPGSRLSVVFTVRGDFAHEILEDRPLLDRLHGAELKLGPMNRDELRSTIAGPAEIVGLQFQEGLIERILQDAGDEPGSLPLLEFALKMLWKNRDGGQLTHAGYEALGDQTSHKHALLSGTQGSPLSRAIATYAEAVYGNFQPAEQQSCPALFRKLVRAGSRSEHDTRRRIRLSDLDETTCSVARALADQRLLITTGVVQVVESSPAAATGGEAKHSQTKPGLVGESASQGLPHEMTVEVAHEELLRRWGRMKGWIDEDRTFLLWRTNLELKLDEFRRDGETAFLRGDPLRKAQGYYLARQADLGEDQQEYLDRCLAAEKRRRRNQWGMVGAGVLTLTMVGLGSWWSWQEVNRTKRLNAMRTAVTAVEKNIGLVAAERIKDLLAFHDDPAALETEIQQRLSQASAREKQSLAYALAALGKGDVGYLCSLIETANADEVDNLAMALSHNRSEALKQLQQLAAQATEAAKSITPEQAPDIDDQKINDAINQRWQWKCRLAVIGLHLGDSTIASDMCQIKDRPDPIERTLFIDRFPAWHGDPVKVLEQVKPSNESALLSAIACGVGGIGRDSISEQAKASCLVQFKEWLSATGDGVLHSSAGWALRQWEEPAAELALEKTDSPPENQGWFRNSLGITMVKIEPGTFVRPREEDGKEIGTHRVTISRPYYLSDREIAVKQFRLFIEDNDYPSEKNQTII